jgi:hypothetical protein
MQLAIGPKETAVRAAVAVVARLQRRRGTHPFADTVALVFRGSNSASQVLLEVLECLAEPKRGA